MLAFRNSQLPQRAEDVWYYKEAVLRRGRTCVSPLREELLLLIRTFCDIRGLRLQSLNFLRYLQFGIFKDQNPLSPLWFQASVSTQMNARREFAERIILHLDSCLFSTGICHQGIYPSLKKKAFLFFIHLLLISTCLSEWLMERRILMVNGFHTIKSPPKPVLK